MKTEFWQKSKDKLLQCQLVIGHDYFPKSEGAEQRCFQCTCHKKMLYLN